MRSVGRAVLAAAAAALMAVSTASATTIHGGVPTGSLYSGNVTFSNVVNVVWTNTLIGSLACTGSTWAGSVASSGGGNLTSVSYTGCVLNGFACTFTASGLPWSLTVSYAPVSGGRDGTMTLTIPANGETESCGQTGPCTYSGTMTGDWFNPNNANKPASSPHAEVRFSNQPLTVNAACGTGTFSGTYAVTGSGGVDLFLEA